ncbi:MAG: hypothetical protein COA96_02105 [SAR86 cluster bacterium]|uniref:Uncharacterized protein n=1 Tax=SAR86 cluster bacterium TaxID=2030880 RepID=A0A2A5B8Y5_9GAMM|nr:MAG: hypothetical protein COA96_02105 [SAR86 cluster bacterium]
MKKIQCFTIYIILALLASGCSVLSDGNAVSINDPTDLLVDIYFIEEGEAFSIDTNPNIFELPDNYKRELDQVLLATESEWERYREVRRWINRSFKDFDFDTTETFSLVELGARRKINCLSFSTMFVAAARYADIPANFQLVFAPPYWDKNGNNWVNNQHINVTGTVKAPLNSDYTDSLISATSNALFNPTGSGYPVFIKHGNIVAKANELRTQRYTVDINPAIINVTIRRELIGEHQVLSLYHSNKSMEALLKNDLLRAYAHTKEALIVDSNSVVAWNNLGVLYSKVGQTVLSIAAYERAIAIDERMYSAKSNLATAYRSQGEIGLAQELERQVEDYRNQNPYYHSALADASMAEGNYGLAINQLQAAVSKKQNEHYFYHQLAIAHQQLGDMDAVIEDLTKARSYARGSEKARFSGKVRALQAILTGSN